MRDNDKQFFYITESNEHRNIEGKVEVNCKYCGKVMITKKGTTCFDCNREMKAKRALKHYNNHK